MLGEGDEGVGLPGENAAAADPIDGFLQIDQRPGFVALGGAAQDEFAALVQDAPYHFAGDGQVGRDQVTEGSDLGQSVAIGASAQAIQDDFRVGEDGG